MLILHEMNEITVGIGAVKAGDFLKRAELPSVCCGVVVGKTRIQLRDICRLRSLQLSVRKIELVEVSFFPTGDIDQIGFSRT